jgi:hypothetical protein
MNGDIAIPTKIVGYKLGTSNPDKVGRAYGEKIVKRLIVKRLTIPSTAKYVPPGEKRPTKTMPGKHERQRQSIRKCPCFRDPCPFPVPCWHLSVYLILIICTGFRYPAVIVPVRAVPVRYAGGEYARAVPGRVNPINSRKNKKGYVHRVFHADQALVKAVYNMG